jgi:hypothetical protein
MTSSDYPLLTVPGYDLYQVACLASFVADGLARHRLAVEQKDRVGRRAAARDVHGARLALARATGDPDLAGSLLPRPLDAETFRAAQGLLPDHPDRQVQVVSLGSLGRDTWAVVGQIPGIGPVGAEVGDPHLAETLRRHMLRAPEADLRGWGIVSQPAELGVDRWGTADDVAVVASLDPGNDQHQVVAAALRGISAELDQAINRRFPVQRPPGVGAGDPAPAQGAEVGAGFAAVAGALTPSERTGTPAATVGASSAVQTARPAPTPAPPTPCQPGPPF